MSHVLVIGAGAVGGYFGACLIRGGHDVTFVARGRNLEVIRATGLRVTGAMGVFSVADVNAVEEPSARHDLALVCVKNYDLDAAVTLIDGSSECALTLQNGVDAPFRTRELLGDIVIGGSTGIVADLAGPGHVDVVSAYAWIRLGELDGGGVSERVEMVTRILDVEGIEPLPVADARVSLWEKMSLMCGMAGLTTLHQRPMGEILTDPSLRATFEAVVRECEVVARALGVGLPADFATSRMAYADKIDPTAMSSMSRDLVRGRPIELDTFNGAMVRMGAELGINVPFNAAIHAGIRAKISELASAGEG